MIYNIIYNSHILNAVPIIALKPPHLSKFDERGGFRGPRNNLILQKFLKFSPLFFGFFKKLFLLSNLSESAPIAAPKSVNLIKLLQIDPFLAKFLICGRFLNSEIIDSKKF